MSTIKVLLALSAVKTWDVHQLDINNAFLHGDLYEEVYMELPKGHPLHGTPGLVCRLLKSLCGLKQASRQWFEKLGALFLNLGYTVSFRLFSFR